MKPILLVIGFVLFLSGFNTVIFSQDIITLRTGDEIKAIVSEIDRNIIRYKKFENQAGPLYTVDKEAVFMIKYENGTRELFELPATGSVEPGKDNSANPATKGGLAYRKPGAISQDNQLLTKDESRSILKKNPQALKLYNSGQKLMKTGSFLVGISLVTSLGVGLLVKNPSITTSIATLSISSGTLIGSITTTLTGRNKVKKAVNVYNSDPSK